MQLRHAKHAKAYTAMSCYVTQTHMLLRKAKASLLSTYQIRKKNIVSDVPH